MYDLARIIALIVTVYLALAMTSVGFAMILGGTRWIPAVLRFWFTAPLQWFFVSLGTAIANTVEAIFVGIGRHLRWLLTGKSR